MREIKFRAWITDYALMTDGNFMNIDYKEIVVMIDENDYEFNCGEYELMQYTGPKDKNGTESYEGDIVRLNDCWGEISGGNVSDTIRTCLVEYSISSFLLIDVLDEEYEEDLGMALINDDEFEVIGNVY